MTRRRVLVALLLSLSMISAPSFAAVKAGAKCTKAGATATAAGKKFTCVKSGKKLVWNKGVAIKAAAPIPSQTAEAKIEVKNLLASDSRITPTSALTSIDVCKTEDMTPDYIEGGLIAHRNGFPRPPRTVSGEKSAKVLVIPLSFTDLPFRDQRLTQFPALLSDAELIKEVIPNVRDSFRNLSGGRFDIQFDVLPKSEWWVLNTDNPFSGNWGVPNIPHIMEIIKKEKSEFNFDGYDTFAFVTGAGYPGQAGLGGAQASYGEKVKNSKSGYMNALLMLGALSNATLWVHELGHSLFSFEDLYLFSQAASGRQVTTGGDTDVPNKWDLMADANKYSLLQWNKLLMGWVYDTEFRCINDQKSSVHYLSLDNPNNDTKLLTVNLAPGVTLAAEARQAPRIDGAGLLLYTIDTYTPHGEGPIISQNNLVGKGQSKSWLGWTFNVLDSNEQGILVEAIKTDIDKFVPPPPKPKPTQPTRPTSAITVTRGEVLPSGFLKARATWDVQGHKSYRLYVTATDDFQKVYFESGYINDDRSQIVVDMSGLVCNKPLRTMAEFYTEKDGKGERIVIPNMQLNNLSCEDTTKKP